MQQPIRVLYVVNDLLEGRGGVQSFVMSVYQHIDPQKVQIDFVFVVDGKPSFISTAQARGSKVYRVPEFKKEGPLTYIRWWMRFFKKHPEYQLVHGHMKAYISLYLGIAKLYGRTTIAHCHSDNPHLPFIKGFIYKLMLLPLRWVTDYQFACSVQAGQYMFGKKTVKKPNFFFIPNARDTKIFAYNQKTRDIIREQLGCKDKFIIGNVGRFISSKNHSFLIKIFQQIYTQNPQARLLLLGNGPMTEQIKKQAENLKLSHAVLFMGVVSNPQDYYQAMDVFIFPSLYEGLGMVLTEAQIAGLPCVFSANLPKEIEIAPELCHRISLKEPATLWAEMALKQANVTRVPHNKEAVEKGFEITGLAKQLEDFYLNAGNKLEGK